MKYILFLLLLPSLICQANIQTIPVKKTCSKTQTVCVKGALLFNSNKGNISFDGKVISAQRASTLQIVVWGDYQSKGSRTMTGSRFDIDINGHAQQVISATRFNEISVGKKGMSWRVDYIDYKNAE
ncbi:MAG: hypothetical protein V7785_23050 [Bermanella sp.]